MGEILLVLMEGVQNKDRTILFQLLLWNDNFQIKFCMGAVSAVSSKTKEMIPSGSPCLLVSC